MESSLHTLDVDAKEVWWKLFFLRSRTRITSRAVVEVLANTTQSITCSNNHILTLLDNRKWFWSGGFLVLFGFWALARWLGCSTFWLLILTYFTNLVICKILVTLPAVYIAPEHCTKWYKWRSSRRLKVFLFIYHRRNKATSTYILICFCCSRPPYSHWRRGTSILLTIRERVATYLKWNPIQHWPCLPDSGAK